MINHPFWGIPFMETSIYWCPGGSPPILAARSPSHKRPSVGDWGCLAATWLPGVTTRGYVENYTRYNSSSNKHAPVSRSNINDGASSVYFWFLSSAVHSMMEPRGSQWHWTTATPNLKFETRMNSVVRVNPSPKEFHGTFRLSHNW
jgi:hypothetical protein